MISSRMAWWQRILLIIIILHAYAGVRASRSVVSGSTGVIMRLRSLQEDADFIAGLNPGAKLHHRPDSSSLHSNAKKLLARQMGSKPPDCQDKCNLCRPCQAVEVPISKVRAAAGQKVKEDSSVQSAAAQPDDTNYMPEIWRCACGDEYYNP